MNKHLRLKANELSAHKLLHVLKDVLTEHPELFEWKPTDKGDASHITHASFDARERTSDIPPFTVHVERLDNEFVGLTLVDGPEPSSDAAEYQKFVERSFYRLYETTMKTKKDEVGLLSYDNTNV
jgi:hypothetical protein